MCRRAMMLLEGIAKASGVPVEQITNRTSIQLTTTVLKEQDRDTRRACHDAVCETFNDAGVMDDFVRRDLVADACLNARTESLYDQP